MSPLGGGGSGGQVRAALPPAQSSPYGSGHYHFVIWDTSNAEQVINKGDNYPLYDDGDYTISGFNYQIILVNCYSMISVVSKSLNSRNYLKCFLISIL